MEPLIGVVNAQLLKGIQGEHLKSENIKDTNVTSHFLLGFKKLVDFSDKPVKKFIIKSAGQSLNTTKTAIQLQRAINLSLIQHPSLKQKALGQCSGLHLQPNRHILKEIGVDQLAGLSVGAGRFVELEVAGEQDCCDYAV
jgi:hypothetical protein